jgi:hypothetical protein
MKNSLNNCPVCDQTLTVTRYYCSHCDTVIEGKFNNSQNPFSQLSPEQLTFLLTFIKCEGRLNRMEEELSLSYPTLRNRLVEVIRVLGFEPGKEDTSPRLTSEDRAKVLDEMEKGNMTFEEAKKMLLGYTE